MSIINEVDKESLLVIGISGSLRKGSYTKSAVKRSLDGAKEFGVKTKLIDLSEYNLPFKNSKNESESIDVINLKNEVKKAHGIILGTPEYHGSFSGALKNALDLMGFTEFEGKMIGLIGVAGGITGAINSLNMLRTVTRQLRAWTVPLQVSIPSSKVSFDQDNNLINKELDLRVIELGKQVAKFTYLHNSQHIKEFMKQWEESIPNPGAN